MPTSIPYDPSLTLMSVVNHAALKNVQAIAELNAPVDAAKDSLNSLISSKRGLTMTKTELMNLGVETKALDAELEKLNQQIEKAAGDYTAAKMAAEPRIMELRKNIQSVQNQVESPMDYTRSEVKTMPIAADTMNLDVQYFAFDSNSQNSAAHSAQIASYVSTAMGSVFGADQAMKMGDAASRQVSHQLSSHSIEGTLVLSVGCTHKNASIVAPFVLHVDKAIKEWNRLFPGKKLDPTSSSSMMKCAMNESQEDREKFSIVSGTTFGSGFVGMVHVLKSTKASASETLQAAAASLQSTMDAGAWFARAGGRVGVDAKFASDVKNLLSQQDFPSQATVLTMGIGPSMVAASRTSGQAFDMQAKTSEGPLSAITTVDEGKDKILDVTSMMAALDDYLKKAAEGNGGVPIKYYLKDIDQKMLAQMWAAKYHPGKFMSIKYDDSEN